MTPMAKPDNLEAPQTTRAHQSLLTDELLNGFAARARRYDEQNTFFAEDFEELREAGYLRLAVPRELGGFGLTLAEVVREQRRLAYHAAPTALAINMHLYWTGMAADLWRAGDTSLTWLLEEAASGRGVRRRPCRERQRHPGAAVDHEGRARRRRLPVHRTQVVRQPVAGLDVSGHPRDGHERSGAAENRARVHAARHRRATASRRRGTCSACAPRAATTRSSTAPFVPDRYVARVVPAGAAGIDAFVLGLFAWALLGFGNIYYGLARRALDLTVETVKSKRSIGLSRSMAYHAEVQHRVAEMGLALEAIGPHLDRIADDWSTGVNHGGAWPAKIFAAKYHAVEDALARRRSGARRGRRIRHLPPERPRAALPRRPARPDPPGELDADARDRGEDAARDQPGRNAAVGLVDSRRIGRAKALRYLTARCCVRSAGLQACP